MKPLFLGHLAQKRPLTIETLSPINWKCNAIPRNNSIFSPKSPLADVMSDTPGIFRKNEDYQRPTEDVIVSNG